jgi:HlyD family secretion protein
MLVAAASAAWYFWRGRSENDANRILLSGNIELDEVDIAFKVPGQLIERAVKEGDRVQRGQTVARLNRDSLLQQREQAVAALDMAKAQLAQAETGLRLQSATVPAELEGRKAELGASQARLRELKTGARPEEIEQARASVAATAAEAERARSDWERAQQLFKDDDISRAQFDAARARFEATQAALKEARERLRLVETGPREEVIEAQASQVERARAGVRIAEASSLEVERRRQEVAARRADVQRAQAHVDYIDTQLNDTIATSPVSGTVLVEAADPGEVIAAGTTVVTVGDLERPWLRGYVSERDLGRVRIAMPVKVSTDAYPGKVYNGRLTWISSEAEFTPKQIQTSEERLKLVYRIKVEVENPNGELKANMPADAELLLNGEAP